MGTKSTGIQGWALPGHGCSCDLCHADDESALEACAPCLAPDARPAVKVSPSVRSVRRVLVDDVFAGQLWTY
jgi:hypothetical protein